MKLADCKVDAWRCPYCYAVVLSDFRKHYQRCQADKRRRQRQYEEDRLLNYAIQRERAFFHAPRLYSTSPQDFIERINFAMYGLYELNINLHIIDIYYSKHVDNTSVAPVGHATNWCHRDKDREFYFNGYKAKMNYDQDVLSRYNQKRKQREWFWDSDILKQFSGLHFGGGSIGYNYGEMFLVDFPKWDTTPGKYGRVMSW